MTAENFARWLSDCDLDYFDGRCSERTRDIRKDGLWDRIDAAGLTADVVKIQNEEYAERRKRIEAADAQRAK